MAMNKYMHPRNPYKKAPDFLQLTLAYPDLRKYVKPDLSGKVKINFKCEGAVRELTKCLLHKDFGLTIELPPDRLVPTLPLRMNYLLWIEDLLNDSGKQFSGIDVGTGASCIYPLLASKHFNWKMTGTEIDEESYNYAVKNVQSNNLKNLINVVRVNENQMLDGVIEDDVIYDFCMCNPPFFSDESEMNKKARTDRRAPPRNFRSGQSFELIAPGGETNFILRIINDSVKIRSKIRVYTVMVGHKSNLNKVKELVKKVKPVRIKTTEFCQGRTTRWGLAWTFSTDSNLISTAVQPRKDHNKPPYRWIYPDKVDLKELVNKVAHLLSSLQIIVNTIEEEEGSCGLCLKAYENTWSHSRRKRREEKRKEVESEVVSPCDSVVTGDSLNSNSPISSPVNSLGYSSCNDVEDVPSIIDKIESSTLSDKTEDVSTDSNISQSVVNFDQNFFKNNFFSSTSNHTEYDKTVNSTNTSQNTEKPNKNGLNISSPSTSSDQISLESPSTSTAKRKCSSPTSEPKRVRREERPLLEAVLVISKFDDDIVFSLSYVDGTGGRESANQVLQYLKNKLTP